MTPAPPVAPRWEWRTSGDRFAEVERRILVRPHERRVVHETSIVSHTSSIDVRIRDNHLYVEVLARTEHGMELWRPVLSTSFPLADDTIAAVFRCWALVPPLLARLLYTQEQFLTEIITPAAGLCVVEVVEHRLRTIVAGCSVEISTLDVSGRTVQTVAVKAERPEQVQHAVAELGLAPV